MSKAIIKFVKYQNTYKSFETYLCARSRMDVEPNYLITDPPGLDRAATILAQAVADLEKNGTYKYASPCQVVLGDGEVYIQSVNARTDKSRKICGYELLNKQS